MGINAVDMNVGLDPFQTQLVELVLAERTPITAGINCHSPTSLATSLPKVGPPANVGHHGCASERDALALRTDVRSAVSDRFQGVLEAGSRKEGTRWSCLQCLRHIVARVGDIHGHPQAGPPYRCGGLFLDSSRLLGIQVRERAIVNTC